MYGGLEAMMSNGGVSASAGYTDVQSWRDIADIERVSGGRRPL